MRLFLFFKWWSRTEKRTLCQPAMLPIFLCLNNNLQLRYTKWRELLFSGPRTLKIEMKFVPELWKLQSSHLYLGDRYQCPRLSGIPLHPCDPRYKHSEEQTTRIWNRYISNTLIVIYKKDYLWCNIWLLGKTIDSNLLVLRRRKRHLNSILEGEEKELRINSPFPHLPHT